MENWFAVGLAVISLVLPVGWQLLKNQLKSAEWLKQKWLGRTAEFFYFVGLPYVALVFGVVTPQLLGLRGAEYFSLISLNTLIPDLQRLSTLLLVEWLVDIGPMITMGFIAMLILGGVIFVLMRYGVTEAHSSETVLDTLYHTLHWAFYWALFSLVVDDFYLGIIIGSAWMILERSLIVRMGKTWLGQQPQQLVSVMILMLTGTIFFYRPNLWLLWPVHLALAVSTRLIQSKIAGPNSVEPSSS